MQRKRNPHGEVHQNISSNNNCETRAPTSVLISPLEWTDVLGLGFGRRESEPAVLDGDFQRVRYECKGLRVRSRLYVHAFTYVYRQKHGKKLGKRRSALAADLGGATRPAAPRRA